MSLNYLKHVKGDLLQLAREGHFNVIVHGCNCFCTMGSGIAKQIKQEYPEAYEADCATVKGAVDKLGTYSVMHGEQFDIVNAYTQYSYNRYDQPKNDRFDYESFSKILRSLSRNYKGCNFGFPYIGMGLAGGDKDVIIAQLEMFALIVELGGGGTVTLVEYSKD
jgi:O-acetyl-ADP-ribose deacetylase (regulator of RNase III)